MRPDPTLASARPDQTSSSLVVAGFLMTLSSLMLANPWFGMNRLWPWALVTDVPAKNFDTAAIALWMGTGALVLLLAFTRAYRFRSTLTLALGIVLTFLVFGGRSRVVIERFGVGEFLALAATGAGLGLGRRAGRRAAGRALAGIGAIGLVVAWGTRFLDGTPEISVYAHDIAAFFQRAGEFQAPLADVPGYEWLVLIPQMLLGLVAAGALVVGLGIRSRVLVAGLFWLFVAALMMPVGVRVARVFVTPDPALSDVSQQLFEGLVADGVALCLLIVLAVGDLARIDPRDAAWEGA